jgi:ankyrin repeat protein
MSRSLPPQPSLDHLKKQAKELLHAFREGDASAVKLLGTGRTTPGGPKLADAQRAIALEYGYSSWSKLKEHVDSLNRSTDPLEQAAAAFKANDAVELRRVLARHPALKARINDPLPGGAFGATPLICAVQRSNREMIDVLLEAGADINARSHWWAGGFGVLDDDRGLAPFLIERGATVDAHAASRLGMADKLKELLAANRDVVHARGGDGQTPLHVAKDVEIARLLLEYGADIDARDVDHESTPAQYALRERQDVARCLVSRGCRTDILMCAALGDVERVRRHLDADPPCIRTSVSRAYFPMQNPRAGGHIYIWTLGANKTAHLVAREFGHEEVLRLLMDRTPDDLKLALACELGEDDLFRAMLARNPELVRVLTDASRRKLADAAQNNNGRAVRLMLEAGWPVDARGQHGATSLHWACFHGNPETVRDILRFRPPLEDTGNDFHGTPLGWAIHGSVHGWHRQTGDYVTTVELLCAAGAAIPREFAGTDGVKTVLRRYADAAKGNS